MRRRFALLVLILAVVVPAARAEQPAGKRRRPPPSEYGRVVIASQAKGARLAPVVFDHWVHRAQYTCRLCHVDLGFAMKAGETGIRAADNQAGQFCGACHDGRTRTRAGKPLFAACKEQGTGADPACDRCHAFEKPVRRDLDFATFTKGLPRGRFGNGVDWEKAEQEGLVKPVDYLEGVSVKRHIRPGQEDFALSAKLPGMPDIIFSHVKHTTWNGCELCHPEIFKVRRGETRTSMVQIFEGQSCGTCHATVAFPLIDCQRCHASPVKGAAP